MPEASNRSLLRSLLFLALLLLQTFVYVIFLLAPALPMLLSIPPLRDSCMRCYRYWAGMVEVAYFGFAAAMLEHLLGVRVVVYGDEVPPRERALILSNHRTRVDWMFIWCLCARTHQLAQLRIVLQDAVKSLPGIGWGCQAFLFVFLARDRSRDLAHMRQVFRYLVTHHYPTTLLLFPEGTDLSRSNLEKAHKYADSRRLQRHDYVLQPKVAGFLETLDGLGPMLDAVYDVTLGYADQRNARTGEFERPSDKALIMGRPPREVHMLVQRIPIKDMPVGDEAALRTWMAATFQAKEQRLRAFYAGRETGAAVAFKGEKVWSDSSGARSAALFGAALFATTLLIACFLLWAFWQTKWYAMSVCCLFTLLTGFGDGLDVLEVRLGGLFGWRKGALSASNHAQRAGAKPKAS
eukprot:TRINITY_DN1604_c1_g2_i2.p1 TRINITY_DN1604_c1_g2~~TRINITY_DN1604_c1_g2_i2.p1  ORF type:complete len:468 (-),score=108.32 TRINITY_DN1604_c1_g2_i2:35-1258(-)